MFRRIPQAPPTLLHPARLVIIIPALLGSGPHVCHLFFLLTGISAGPKGEGKSRNSGRVHSRSGLYPGLLGTRKTTHDGKLGQAVSTS